MEAKHFILPVAALVIGGVFLGGQRKRITELRAGSAELRVRISEARVGGGGDGFSSPSARADKPSADKQPIDWKKLAEEMRENRQEDGIGQMRAMMGLQRRLMAMDTQELLAALDQIAGLDVDEETRMELEGMIVDPLSRKAPELALERFKHRLEDQGGAMAWHLSSALARLAEKDLGAATAWMSKEVSAGTFDTKSLDGRNSMRMRFESNLLSQMIKVDPSTAATRLSGMDMVMRKEALEAIRADKFSPQEQVAHADLIRNQLNPADQLAALGKRASNLAIQKGFTEVDAYLERIAATPEERKQSVEDAASGFLNGKRWEGGIKEEDIDAMREWTAKSAPEAVGRLTGQGVGEALNQDGGMDFPKASALALRYAGADGGDDVLVGFLEKVPSTYKGEAREMAAKISDPQRREGMLKRFE
jgi:hypothetical protein